MTQKDYDEFCGSQQFKAFGKAIDEFIEAKKEESQTAALWLQYIDYVNIVKLFVFAERTSNWFLHIDAIKRMFNLFAATGHINYANAPTYMGKRWNCCHKQILGFSINSRMAYMP